MALPTSGALTLDQIIEEVFGSTGATSTLGTCGSVAGFTAPISMSDFYGYSSGGGTAFDAGYHLFSSSSSCSIPSQSFNTYYHDGANQYPLINDKIYSDSAMTTVVANGYYSFGAAYVRVYGGTGLVVSTGIC